ncbi:class I SAM-dependent methyltransferase [Pseudoxanthomonas sp. UTMC 1351]|uniref:class I SAM-dependent methyltransferase n=1 Tax=Pseudoxanthomonas sp. UTMC 1351 TaxID=2695853 RepID=UPI0034CF46FE
MDASAPRGAPPPPGGGAPVSGDRDAAAAESGTAQTVSTFYETHPYPPPIESLDAYRQSWDDARRRADAALFWPTQGYRDDRRILVAGCGTSQAAKYAVRWPRAQVTGIDVSQASIAQTQRLKDRHGLDNLQLKVMPVERASDLAGEFDQVVCTGVLHHLPDPDHGLRALREVLAPDGAMHLMLYAPYGRTGVYMLQDYCRRLGIGSTSSEIHELASALGMLPREHPLVPLLHNMRDFHSEAGLADALLHPQDRAYSVPQMFDLLAGAGLEFGRWLRQAAYLPQCGLFASSPHRSRLEQLPASEQYAAVELFRGSMVHHSLVAYRNDYARRPSLSFDGDAWLDYVPIRLPETIAVQKNLPASAEAVLINRSHTCTDVYLPVDARQKILFDRIDGARTIRDIADRDSAVDSDSAVDDAALPIARTLFEQLWNYDQVVFAMPREANEHAPSSTLSMPEGNLL